MGKCCRNVMICLILACAVWLTAFFADRQNCRQEWIRIADGSDTLADLSLLQTVRDAAVSDLVTALGRLTDPEVTRDYLRHRIPKIRDLTSQVLQVLGCYMPVSVTLVKKWVEDGNLRFFFSQMPGRLENIFFTG